MKPILLPGETVECVYAQRASGPGWHNRPLWVIVSDQFGNMRRVCIQPVDHGPHLAGIYAIACEVHAYLVGAVTEQLAPKPRKRKVRRG